MKPVLVYLDSQDFSRFGSSRVGSEDRQIFFELMHLKESGKAIFGFSYVHVVELFSPTDAENAEKELNKAAMLKKLCDNNAFPFISDALAGAEFPNDGCWAPRNAVTNLDIKRLFEVEIAKAKKRIRNEPGVSRGDRRKLASNTGFRKAMQNVGSGNTNESAAQRNLSDKVDFRRAILDKSYQSELGSRIVDAMTDPSLYGRLVYETFGNRNPLLDGVHRIERPMIQKLSEAIEIGLQFDNQLKELKARVKAIATDHKRLGLEPGQVLKDLERKVKELSANRVKNLNIANRLGSHRFGFLDYYVEQMLNLRRAPKSSDIRDLFHIFYAIDVDFIRLDKSMASIMDKYEPISKKVVANLRDLPEAIEKMYELSA